MTRKNPEAALVTYAERIHLLPEDVDYLLVLMQEARVLSSKAGAEAEREACAKLAELRCEEWIDTGDGESVLASQSYYGMADAGREIAAAIRARKE